MRHQSPTTPAPLNTHGEHPPQPRKSSEYRVEPPQFPEPPGNAPAKDDPSRHLALSLDRIQQLPKQRRVDSWEPSGAKRLSALHVCCRAQPAHLPRDLLIIAICHQDLDRSGVLERDPKRE